MIYDLGLLLTPRLVQTNKYIQEKKSCSTEVNGKKCCQVLGEAGFHPMGGFSDQKKILVLAKFEHMLSSFNVR